MPALDVLNIKNEKVGKVTLGDQVFAPDADKGLLHQVVVAQQAAARAGSAKTKERAEVSGGGCKPWRQKGTGRARAGSNRSPLWRGGGTVFGPRPRDYSQHLPKKVKRIALYQALGIKLRGQDLLVVQELIFEKPSTKEFIKVMTGLNISHDKNILIVTDQQDENLVKSCRNLARAKVIPLQGLNVYEILKADKLLFTEKSVQKLEEVWGQ